MKNFFRAFACATVFLGMTSANAAPPASDGDTVQIKAPSRYKVDVREFEDYAYSYELTNGKTIKFTRGVQKFYAQLDGEARTEMTAEGPGQFLTSKGALVQFRDDGETVGIRNYERLAVSEKLSADTIVMAKR